MKTHKIRFDPTKAFQIDLVGAGGNGSQMLGGLARLNMALIALGYEGFNVNLYDADIVSMANVGRQLFSVSDVGQYKSIVLIHRINMFYGTSWYAAPENYSRNNNHASIVIGCVDTKAARRSIHAIAQRSSLYWLDLGNRATDGQVVLGQPVGKGTPPRVRENMMASKERLPTVLELFPEMTNKKSPEDNTPSCSLAEALEKQDLFINQGLATFALNLLWQLLRHKEIDHHGYFVNLKSGRVAPIPCDPLAWERIAGVASRRTASLDKLTPWQRRSLHMKPKTAKRKTP